MVLEHKENLNKPSTERLEGKIISWNIVIAIIFVGYYFFITDRWYSLWILGGPVGAILFASVIRDERNKNPNNKCLILFVLCFIITAMPFVQILSSSNGVANKQIPKNSSQTLESSATKTKSINQDNNPFNEESVPLRNIQADQQKYLGKNIVIGPVKVVDNDVERAQYRVRPSTGAKGHEYDQDVDMQISYKDSPEYSKWRDLSSGKRPIIYVRGKIIPVQGSKSLGMVATEIKFIAMSE